MKLGVQMLPVAAINDGESVQARASRDDDLVSQYAAEMQRGDKFPPIVVFFDGDTYRIADGFHRYAAVISNNGTEVEADVREGSRFDAVIYAVGANAVHGLRRSNRDKRHAVELLLAEPKAQSLSDRDIARYCGVSHPFVAAIRRPPPPSGNAYQAEGAAPPGNQSRSLPSHRQSSSSATTPPSSPRADEAIALAAHLEGELQRITERVCSAPHRTRLALTPILDIVIPKLSRARTETAA